MDENQIVGNNLKILRKANGYTKVQLSTYLNVQESSYSNYETGIQEIPIDILEKACKLIGCELELMFEEDITLVMDMQFCVFNTENMNRKDIDEIGAFKDIVLNYMKMERLLTQ